MSPSGSNRSEKIYHFSVACFFGDDGDLVHIFDRRVDAGEDADLWERDSAARQSVEHSLRDGRQS